MQVVKGDNTVYFDVDDTLLTLHGSSPIDNSIKLLQYYKNQGRTIIVWSQGGVDKCLEAIKLLELEKYVDLVVAKPLVYVDDLDCKAFMTKRISVDEAGNLETVLR